MSDIDLTRMFYENIFIFKVYGYWKFKHYFMGLLLRILSVGILFSFVLTQATFLALNYTNLREVTSTSYSVLTFSMNLVKLAFMYMNLPTLLYMMQELNGHFFRPKCQDQRTLAGVTKAHYKKVFYFCLTLGLTVDVFWAIYPIPNPDRVFPFRAWVPEMFYESPYMEITYFYQLLAAVMNTVICLNLDCFSAGLLVEVGLQCDMLSYILQNLDKFCLDANKEMVELSSLKDESRKLINFNTMMLENLIYCVKYYKNIKIYAKKIEKIHFKSIFLLFGIGTFVLCASLFEISLTDPLSMEFIMMTSYSMAILVELFLYCWFGTEVIYKSGEILNAIYKSPWLNCDLKYKKTMLMFMTASKYPIIVYVGGLFTMSIPVYIAILRSSYSYFTLLRNVYN